MKYRQKQVTAVTSRLSKELQSSYHDKGIHMFFRFHNAYICIQRGPPWFYNTQFLLPVFFVNDLGGFHVTSLPPCWWTVNNRSLLVRFVRPPAFVSPLLSLSLACKLPILTSLISKRCLISLMAYYLSFRESKEGHIVSVTSFLQLFRDYPNLINMKNDGDLSRV